MHDAILIGVGTLLADDPQLTVRLVAGNSPVPVVLDSQLRTPLSSRLVSAAAEATIVGRTCECGIVNVPHRSIHANIRWIDER